MKTMRKMQGRRCSSAVDIQHSSPTDHNCQSGDNRLSRGGNFSTVPDDDSVHSNSTNKCVKTVSPHSMTSPTPDDEQLSQILKTIGEQSNDLLKAWDLFSPSDDPHRRVLNIHFRLMIDQLCPQVSSGDQAFQSVLQQLQPVSKHAVSYEEFRAKLLDSSCQVIDTRDNYEYFDRTTALEEVEIHLRNKMIANVALICRMFLLVDRRQVGSIHISDMKKIIEHCCLIHLHDNTYNKLWLRYDPRHTQLIDYADFLKRLAINVSNYHKTRHNLNMKTALTWPEVEIVQDDSHQKRLAILRGVDDQHLRDQPLSDICQRLQSKVWSVDKILTKAFQVLDATETGRAPLEACRTLLSYFTFALSPNTFNHILCSLGLDETETIDWKSFLNRIKGQQLSSRKWSSAPIRRQNDATNQPQHLSAPMNNVSMVDEVRRALKRCQGRQLQYNFNYKTNGEPCITRQELRLVLARLGIRMNQQQFKQLTIKLDPDHTNLITYQRFSQFFLGSDERRPVGTPLEHTPQPRSAVPSVRRSSSRTTSDGPCVSWPKLLARLKERVHANYDNIEKVLRSCDYQRQGWISPSQLRLLLNHFCFSLSNEEFNKILYELQDVEGMINVRKFTQTFYQTEKERLQKWSSLVSRLTKAGLPHPWTHEQLDCMWTQLMATFGSSLVARFEQLQQDTVGQVPPQHFHQHLCTYTGWLYQDEFDYLWDRYISSALDNLDELINVVEVASTKGKEDTQSVSEIERQPAEQEVASEVDERPTSRPKTTSHTQRQSTAVKREQRRRPKTVGPRGYFSADLALRRVLAQRWMDIKQRCLETDLEEDYTLPAHTFMDILSDAGVPVQSKYLLRLLPLRYNVQSLNPQAPVEYIKFLTNLFLTCGNDNKEELPAAVGNILLDMRKSILSQWKTINKVFRRHDVLGTGKIHMSKFLNILSQQLEVKLSDHKVVLLSQYLDPQTTGAIRYKDFFHIFMKSI